MSASPSPAPRPEPPAPRSAARIGAAVVAVAILAILVWRVADVLLAVFAGLLLAVLLDALVIWLRHYVPVPRAVALGLVLLAVLGSVAVFWVVAGPALALQATRLGDQIPAALQQLDQAVRETQLGPELLQRVPPPGEVVRSGARLMGRVPGMFSTVVGSLTNTIFALLIALYVAWNPGLYRNGVRHLVPLDHRERADEVLAELGHALRWWLIGRIAAMTAIGFLTGLGLWIIDLPLALVLGVIAGLFAFVPFIGPIASAVPALLIALGSGLDQAFWVVVIYSGVQFLEGNLLTPIIQQRAVSLPPAVLLASQLLLGVLFGVVGVLLATPLTVVLIVLVQMLYVRDFLGDPVRLLGRRGPIDDETS